MPSHHITAWPKSAAHQAFCYTMGVPRGAMSKPIVRVANIWNETVPCNITLRRQAKAAVTHPGASKEKSCFADI